MWSYTYVFIILITFCFCDVQPNNKADENEDFFVPTHEWQVVKKDQKIPKGLHVRINLKSGLTEAKLIKSEDKSNAVATAPESESKDGGKFSEAELKDALKNIRNEDPLISNREKKFRSYDELKKDLDELKLTPKTDAEILHELVENHAVAFKLNDGDEIVTILEDIEYLVHQYDNANEFIRLDGLKRVVLKDLNSTNDEIKQHALKIFGAAMQNNAKVQIHALESGALGVLLRIVALDPHSGVKNKAAYALSSLLRQFPLAQRYFIENAGLNVFLDLSKNTNNIKMQLKFITLVSDLLLEHKYIVEDVAAENRSEKIRQYSDVHLKEKLKKHNWCAHLYKVLVSVVYIDEMDHDAIEKCLNALILVLDTCSSNILHDLHSTVAKLGNNYRRLTKGSDPDDSDYYGLLWNLTDQIVQYNRVKVEL